jgi:hypothetical protein
MRRLQRPNQAIQRPDQPKLLDPERGPQLWVASSRAADPMVGRATRVPDRTDNPGTERTTTVTHMFPMTWSPSALAA